ncbi:phospholipase A and acyltransferase 3-like [Brienomyrus brachyistius]|uniref:phospholipase A and acyltransferase 3-like n=1 Tax=Brienomyrus brachyistius TaxID=42636 RepID=UPI0020B229BF|nr:phospholipase A and acyltransferase 3-like [Brienomyrus brachyistius]XP_048884659.1 phospholipase A and acyltransferase 3-like [Brienomyrus brachyistius]XP_048884660.1 phospholipase A and acyltransferase 3-like [Brienomyrus brachyistius]
MAPTLYDEKPKPGDLIEIFRGTYNHWAMYVGDDYIIHLAPPSEEACGGAYSMMSVLHDKAIVKMDSLCHVVGTSKFRINNLLDDKYEPRSVSSILKDARSWVGQELPYCVFRGNCEHFVTELRYGKPESRQVRDAVQTAIGVGAAAIGVGLLAAAAVAIFGSGRKERRNSQ